MILLLCSPPLAADDFANEYKIKAGYLYNFTKFITWPEHDATTFNLCILGSDPFGILIDAIEKKTVKDRPIRVLRLNGFDQKIHCHIIFTGTAEGRVKNLTSQHGSIKTLTVGESQDFAAQGGMIGFVNREGRIKLQINPDAIRQGGLKISAKLLEVAEILRSTGHE
ncbi:MAG: YfiR family protein [Methylococcaceae bacterium]|nr:YfiR family protein [Methylococcaceae bacterium]